MKSKDFKVLIERLEKDNGLLQDKRRKIYNLSNVREKEQKDLLFYEDLIDYHETMINYIKKLDKELYE